MAKSTVRTSVDSNGFIVADGNADGSGSSGGDVGGIVASIPGLVIIDPATIGDGPGSDSGSGGDNSSEPRKRRGRKPGSTNSGTRAKTASLDIGGIESILLSAHAMLAGITRTSEFALDKAEAKQLAEGISNVSRHYDIAATQKSMDWTNLLMLLGMIYGTRIYAVRARRAAAKKDTPRQASSADNVIIPGVGTFSGAGLVQ